MLYSFRLLQRSKKLMRALAKKVEIGPFSTDVVVNSGDNLLILVLWDVIREQTNLTSAELTWQKLLKTVNFRTMHKPLQKLP